MKIRSTTVTAPRQSAIGGITALATAMTLAAISATAGEGASAKIFAPPCHKSLRGNTIATYRSLETSKRLPTKQVKEALEKYEGVVVIGTPVAVASLLAELDDFAEIVQEGEFPFHAKLIAITLADLG